MKLSEFVERYRYKTGRSSVELYDCGSSYLIHLKKENLTIRFNPYAIGDEEHIEIIECISKFLPVNFNRKVDPYSKYGRFKDVVDGINKTIDRACRIPKKTLFDFHGVSPWLIMDPSSVITVPDGFIKSGNTSNLYTNLYQSLQNPKLAALQQQQYYSILEYASSGGYWVDPKEYVKDVMVTDSNEE